MFARLWLARSFTPSANPVSLAMIELRWSSQKWVTVVPASVAVIEKPQPATFMPAAVTSNANCLPGVAAVTVLQLRFTRLSADDAKR